MDIFDKWAEPMTIDCAAARNSITISAISLLPPRRSSDTPFWHLWASWVMASRRGAQVTFILPAPSKIHPATLNNLAAAQAAHDQGMHTRFVQQPNLLHAKTAVIDRSIIWIGSGNMTAAAAHHNHEIYTRGIDPTAAAAILSRWERIST